jgi:small subunit ribosomal protein S7
MNKNTPRLKEKILNHILKNGKKKTSEKMLNKSFKLMQKSQKKSHNEIFKLSIINSTPTFRVIKLKNNKRRKKKSIKEIPAFLSTYMFRSSWALKYLIQTSKKKQSGTFFDQLKTETLLSAKYEGNTIKLKNEVQDQALQKKKYFRHYRW